MNEAFSENISYWFALWKKTVWLDILNLIYPFSRKIPKKKIKKKKINFFSIKSKDIQKELMIDNNKSLRIGFIHPDLGIGGAE